MTIFSKRLKGSEWGVACGRVRPRGGSVSHRGGRACHTEEGGRVRPRRRRGVSQTEGDERVKPKAGVRPKGGGVQWEG